MAEGPKKPEKPDDLWQGAHLLYETVADKPLRVAAVRIEPRDERGEPADALRTRAERAW